MAGWTAEAFPRRPAGVEGDAAWLRPRHRVWPKAEVADVLLPIADTAEARLVLTDELVRRSLERGQSRAPKRGTRGDARESAQCGQTILSCIDSRTSAELIFDQGLGDVFSIRMAGNVLSDMVLGSMEFACKLAGSRLLVVLGHTSCGAIKGACDNVQLGNLSTLLNLIQPAVYFERTVTRNRTSRNLVFVDKVAELQVRRSVEGVIERSMVLRGLIEQRQIGLIGGMYDVASGAVRFMDDTWMCGEVRHFFLDANGATGAGTIPRRKAARRPAARRR